MQALARYVMTSPVKAVLITVLAHLIPVIGAFSGAVIALVVLRQGVYRGAVVLAGVILLSGLLSYLLQGNMDVAFAYTLMLWLPVLGLAAVLRATVSWTLTLGVTGAVALLFLGAVYVTVGDPAYMWEQRFLQGMDRIEAEARLETIDISEEQIKLLARYTAAGMVMGFPLFWLFNMFLARWWQAVLYNPGGFRGEFHALRQSQIMAVACLGILVLTVTGGGVANFASDAMMVMLVLFGMAGLSLVHVAVARTGRHVGWLVGLYVLLLFFLPQMIVVLAALGFSDTWLDFRRRLAGGPEDGGPGGDNRIE